MNSTRRMVLRSLVAAGLTGLVQMPRANGNAKLVNLVGVGGVGRRLARLFADQHPVMLEHHFIGLGGSSLDDADRVAVQPIGRVQEPTSGPLIIVAGLGGHAKGDFSYQCAREWAQSQSTTIKALFIVPFAWEGQRRARAFPEAERFANAFGRVVLIDNQRCIVDRRETRLDFFARVDGFAMDYMARLVAASTTGVASALPTQIKRGQVPQFSGTSEFGALNAGSRRRTTAGLRFGESRAFSVEPA